MKKKFWCVCASALVSVSCSVAAEEMTSATSSAQPSASTSSAPVAAQVPVIPVTDLPCVDASGPNSATDDIVHAALDTPVMVGAERLVAEIEYASRMPSEVDPYEVYSARYYSGEIPEGGDAEFAEIACDLAPYSWGSTLTPDELAGVLAAPGFVRSQGRRLCASLHDSDDPQRLLDDGDDELAEYASTPEGVAAQFLTQAEERLTAAEAEVSAPTPEDMTADDVGQLRADAVESARRDVDHARAQTDESVQYGPIAMVESMKAAYRHQCP